MTYSTAVIFSSVSFKSPSADLLAATFFFLMIHTLWQAWRNDLKSWIFITLLKNWMKSSSGASPSSTFLKRLFLFGFAFVYALLCAFYCPASSTLFDLETPLWGLITADFDESEPFFLLCSAFKLFEFLLFDVVLLDYCCFEESSAADVWGWNSFLMSEPSSCLYLS